MMTQFVHIRNSILDPPETLVWPYSLYVLQQQGSSAATEMEVERLKRECNRTLQMVQQWKKMYENLHEFCVNELLDGDQVDGSKRNVVWEGCSPCTNSFTGLAVLLVVGGMNSRLDPFEGYFLVFICSFFSFFFGFYAIKGTVFVGFGRFSSDAPVLSLKTWLCLTGYGLTRSIFSHHSVDDAQNWQDRLLVLKLVLFNLTTFSLTYFKLGRHQQETLCS